MNCNHVAVEEVWIDRKHNVSGVICHVCGDTIWQGDYDSRPESMAELEAITRAAEGYEPIEISSGLGIGGYGSDDYNILTERPAEYNRPKSESRGKFCHYCGQPASRFGFFDEPVCPGCGG